MAGFLKVCISGPLYSSLFYEHATTLCDQEGFLLGEVANRITDVISDAQIRGEKQETYLNIYGFIPCHMLFSFYNSSGEVNTDSLSEILNGKEKDVIGWYKFRRNTFLQVSLREKAVHCNLASKFISVYERHFLFGLFTSSSSTNHSTHSFDQMFLHYNGWSFQPLPIRIENLRDMDHSEYQMFPVSAVNVHSGQYSEILKSEQFSTDCQVGAVNQAKDVLLILQKKLEGLEEQLQLSEAIVASTEMEVQKLRMQVVEKTGNLRGHKLSTMFLSKEPNVEVKESFSDDEDEDNLRT